MVIALSFRLKIPDRRVLNSELRKLSGEAKRDLAHKLLIEADNGDNVFNHNPLHDSYQDSEFENPFNTKPPAILKSLDTPDGVPHNPCLKPDRFTALKLQSVKPLGEMTAEYTFSLPQPTDCTGCFPGQYVQVRIGKNQRFLSPVSRVKEFGRISLLLKYETHGVFSNAIRSLQVGKEGACDFSLIRFNYFFGQGKTALIIFFLFRKSRTSIVLVNTCLTLAQRSTLKLSRSNRPIKNSTSNVEYFQSCP